MGIFGKPETRPPDPPPPAAPRAAVAPPPAATPQTSGARSVCVIGPKTTIKGELTGDEDVLVEGAVEGQIRISRDLRIGPGGSVKATVEAQSVVVSGELLGDCRASQRVEIQATGRLTGNIGAPRVVIAEGASFRGNSDMSGRREERKDKAAAS
ncbi:MAG TPA: polymer-forming cytoskeletal protein [Vicinamibacteria bacterium]|nr:polymer-forming cytoskeletal protein [Vicinamibacteria bacterium]